MQKEIENLKELIVNDYQNWTSRSAYSDSSERDKERVAEFASKIEVKEGQKYIKIISDRSVWGFIVKTETDKLFQKGDILKPAGWAAPARNFARGNILDGGYEIRWTGA